MLRLRARLLTDAGRCLKAGVCLAKSWLVFRDSAARRELVSSRNNCCKVWRSALERLLGLRTEGLSRQLRAARFVGALLETLPAEETGLAAKEVRWFLAWFPQTPGSDSIRASYAGFLTKAGLHDEALREYLALLEIRDGNVHTAWVARKAASLARQLGRNEAFATVLECLEASAKSSAISEATRASILAVYAELCASEPLLRAQGMSALERLLDRIPVPYIPPQVLWEYAKIYREAGQERRAEQCLRFLAERFPENSHAGEARELLVAKEASSAGVQPGQAGRQLSFGEEGLRFPLSKEVAREVKRRLLEQINRDRVVHGLAPVAFDSLASAVADRHCQEALQHNYHGHYDLRGFKPHHRYALAGGYDALSENFSLTSWRGFDINFDDLVEMVLEGHRKMMDEKPPNDGHRRNVLAPQHNACGIGLAVGKRGLRFSEEFLDRYVHLDVRPPIQLTREQAGGKTLWLAGRAINGARVVNASVDYEPWPKPMSPAEINRTHSYSPPGFKTSLVRMIRAAHLDGRMRADTLWYWKDQPDLKFHFTAAGKEFRLPVVLREPRRGIYTVTIWVRKHGMKNTFPAAYVCVFVK